MSEQDKLMAKLAKRAKGAWTKSKGAEVKVKGSQLPDGIVRGVARFTSYKVAEDKKGDPYFTLTGVVVEPSNCAGIKANISHFIKETQNKTIQDKLDSLSSDIQLLGGEDAAVNAGFEGGLADTDLMDLPKVLDQMVADKPHFYFNTWKPKADARNPNPQVMIFIQGLATDWNPPDDYNAGDEGGEGEVAADEPQVDPDPPKPAPKPKAAPAKAPPKGPPKAPPKAKEPEPEPEPDPTEGEPEAGDEEDAPWKPNPGEVYLCRFAPKGKPEEAEVVKVDEAAETVTLKREHDGKTFKDIAWSRLEGAG